MSPLPAWFTPVINFIVEETINGKALWNQPAGHLEANETLLQAAERELWEETGIRATPQHFIRMHQWLAPDNTPFLRFLFAIELSDLCATEPHDSDIDRRLWLSAEEILTRRTCARRWLPKAFAATCRTRGSRCR